MGQFNLEKITLSFQKPFINTKRENKESKLKNRNILLTDVLTETFMSISMVRGKPAVERKVSSNKSSETKE